MSKKVKVLDSNTILYKCDISSLHNHFFADRFPKCEYKIKAGNNTYERVLLSYCPLCEKYFINNEYYNNNKDRLNKLKIKDTNKANCVKEHPIHPSKKILSGGDYLYLLFPNEKNLLNLYKMDIYVSLETALGEEWLKLPGYGCKLHRVFFCDRKVFLRKTKDNKPSCKVLYYPGELDLKQRQKLEIK